MSEQSAVIVGASGGIGTALADLLSQGGGFATVHRCARRGAAIEADYARPETLAEMAAVIAAGPPPALVIVATGLLHRGAQMPEKSLGMIEPGWMAENFLVNAIGPMLVARHLLPLMPRKGRAVFAALSARVGSISDNRAGGWHSYRASKAALNQYVRTQAIEWQRSNPASICVALHPGTVDSAMSAPFQRGVPPEKLFTPAFSAQALLAVLDRLEPEQSGRIFAWDGQEIAP